MAYAGFTQEQLSNPNYTQEYDDVLASVTVDGDVYVEVYVQKHCGDVEKADFGRYQNLTLPINGEVAANKYICIILDH